MTYFSEIVATGSYLPSQVLTNQDLEQMVETSDEWIVSRTGIKQRHIANDIETTSYMAYMASMQAIEQIINLDSNFDVNSLDLIIVATFSPEMVFPSTACLLHNKLGIERPIAAFDINAVCSGFAYALATADNFIKSNMANNVLVVGVDAMSRFIDYTDRKTCVLFGDGAASIILRRSEKPGIIANMLHANGRGADILTVNSHISKGRITGNPYVYMDGPAVFKMAVKSLTQVTLDILQKNNYTVEDIDWFIPHQANIRIMEATAKALKLPMEKVIATVDKHGNTSAASIPLALDYGIKNNMVNKGDLVVSVGVGGGFTWGANLFIY